MNYPVRRSRERTILRSAPSEECLPLRCPGTKELGQKMAMRGMRRGVDRVRSLERFELSSHEVQLLEERIMVGQTETATAAATTRSLGNGG